MQLKAQLRQRADGEHSYQVIDLEQAEAEILGGHLETSGHADLGNLLDMRLDVRWQNLDAERAVAIWPELQGLGGRFFGHLTLERAQDPRALEPMRADFVLESGGGQYPR